MSLIFEYATSAEGVAFVLNWCRDNGRPATAILLESGTYSYLQTSQLVEMETHVPVLKQGCMGYINDTSLFVVRGVPHGEIWLYDAPITTDVTSEELYNDFKPVSKISKDRGVFS